MLYTSLEKFDPEVDSIIKNEEKRQRESLELIASENFTSVSVLQANSSILTNKYSEGQVGCRYYGGNENIDQIEALCKKRALALFGLDPEEWGVNVQLLSGSVANFAVYTALASKDGKIMGLDLPSGGHLTHGYQTSKRKVSATSLFFQSKAYKCGKDGLIDYERLENEVSNFDPCILICGGSAYPRECNYARLREIAGGRILMMDMAHVSGFIASGTMDDPFKYCDVVTTTAHKILRGPRCGMIFYRRKREGRADPRDIGPIIESAVFPGLQGGPHNQKIAALAVALKQAATKEYREYAQQTLENARMLSIELQKHGYKVLTNGTDCHIVMLCLEDFGGAEVEKLCELANICVNKNCIVTDTSPLRPSAIRLGTPAMTTRGFTSKEFIETAAYLHEALVLTRKLSGKANDANGKVDLAKFTSLAAADERVKNLKGRVVSFVTPYEIPCFNYRSTNQSSRLSEQDESPAV